MAATNVETLTNPRDSLPNVYTSVTAREMDFVTRFGDNWEALRNILGIMRPIRKTPGTSLVSYTADVTLESGTIDPGKVIPYSKATITQATKSDLSIEKYAKAVPIEDVNKYGAEIAVEKSDDAFLTKLQNVVLNKFYTFLKTGTLYRVLQAHSSQESWTPEAAPSLFARVLIPDPDTVPDWVQPDSTNAYSKGDRVRHNGKTWTSDIDGNIWEPGQYGWTEETE